MPNYKKNSAKDLESREKARMCLELRLAGWSFDAISRHPLINFSDPSGARKAVLRLMDRVELDTVEEARALEIQRLDAILKSIWQRVRQGDLGAIDRAIRVMDQRAKLLGLNKPQVQPTVDITKMTKQELEEFIATFNG